MSRRRTPREPRRYQKLLTNYECLLKYPTVAKIHQLDCYRNLPKSFRYNGKSKSRLRLRELCEALGPLADCPWRSLPPSLARQVPAQYVVQKYSGGPQAVQRQMRDHARAEGGRRRSRFATDDVSVPRDLKAPDAMIYEYTGTPKPLRPSVSTLDPDFQSPEFAAIQDKVRDQGFQAFLQFLESPAKYAAYISGPRGPPLSQDFFKLPYYAVKLLGRPTLGQPIAVEKIGYGASTCFGYRFLFDRKFRQDACLGTTDKRQAWQVPIKVVVSGIPGIRRKVYVKTNAAAYNELIKCLKPKTQTKLIILPMEFEIMGFKHAQVLTIDVNAGEIHYFDSQGLLFGLYKANDAGKLVIQVLRQSFPFLGETAFKFHNVYETVGVTGPAINDGVFGVPLFKIRPEDRTGYSDIWCLMYATLRTMYREVSNDTVIRFLKSFTGSEKREILYRFSGYLAREEIRLQKNKANRQSRLC